MRISGLAVLLVTLACGEAPSLAADLLPPTQEVLTVLSDSQWQLTAQRTVTEFKTEEFAYTVTVPVTIEREEIVDGKPVKKIATEYRQETRTGIRKLPVSKFVVQVRTVDPKSVKAFSISGKELTAEQVAERCKGDTLVVVSNGKEMVGQSYARLFKDETIVLALQGQSGSVPGLLPTAPPSEPAAPKVPNAPQPSLLYASTDGGERINIRQYDQVVSTATATAFENDAAADGKTLPVEQVSQQSTTTSIPWSLVRMSAPGSNSDVPTATAKAAFSTKERLVVVSADGKAVDKFWLQNFRSFVPVVRGVRLPANSTLAMQAMAAMPAMPQAIPSPQPVQPQPPAAIQPSLPQPVNRAPASPPAAPVTAPS